MSILRWWKPKREELQPHPTIPLEWLPNSNLRIKGVPDFPVPISAPSVRAIPPEVERLSRENQARGELVRLVREAGILSTSEAPNVEEYIRRGKATLKVQSDTPKPQGENINPYMPTRKGRPI